MLHKFLTRSVFTFVTTMSLSLLGCSGQTREESGGDVAGPWSPTSVREIKGVDANAVRAEIAKLVAGSKPEGFTDHQWTHLKNTYESNSGGPLWLEKDGVGDRIKSLSLLLTESHGDGLRLDAYPIARLAQSVEVLENTKRVTAAQLATADAMFTAAYVALAEDLLTGQVDPRTVAQSWHIDPEEKLVDSAIVRTLRAEDLKAALGALRPTDEHYELLKKDLERYRQMVARGGWQSIPGGPSLKRGRSGPRVAALESRLRAEGFLTDSAATPGMFDDRIAAAVAQWQSRHGIAVDSALGPQTLEALNRPATFRLGQIAANLERLRWLPRSLGDRYLLVNVPAFRLEGFEGGKKVIEMKVIVGAEYEGRATPVFSDTMTHVVFRPYWNVTDNIANNELWPLIRSNPGYMAQHNYETWSDGGVTRLRQRPGPTNSLGLVKFMFPNSFNIYLHDTPNGELFKEDMRAFSHGCIRVEEPDRLAQWVLGWEGTRVEQAMNSGSNNRTVNLPKSLPVYIGYFTAYHRDGNLHFGNDLYDRDDKLVAAMASGGSSGDAISAAQRLQLAVE